MGVWQQHAACDARNSQAMGVRTGGAMGGSVCAYSICSWPGSIGHLVFEQRSHTVWKIGVPMNTTSTSSTPDGIFRVPALTQSE